MLHLNKQGVRDVARRLAAAASDGAKACVINNETGAVYRADKWGSLFFGQSPYPDVNYVGTRRGMKIYEGSDEDVSDAMFLWCIIGGKAYVQ